MPVEFRLEPTGSSDNSLFRLTMAYDGSGRRISKTRWVKKVGAQDWEKELVTHYTGIGTEVRENFAGPTKETKVVVNMPQGLGRYGIEDAERPDFDGMTGDGLIGYIPNTKFEWYLKNHLGSTMLVYGTQADANPAHSDIGTPLAAYDYRAFGEMVELTPPSTGKVTENFTGSRFTRRTQRTACKSIAEPKNLGAKRNEHDDEIALNYFGARYLDPMLGMWISVDPAMQFSSPYLYAGNGMNPLSHYDANGNYMIRKRAGKYEIRPMSKWSAISGALFRDVPGAIMSVLPNPLIQKLGLAWGVLKSKAQNSYASTTISTIASKGVDKAFVDDVVLMHVDNALTSHEVFKYTIGVFVGGMMSLADMGLGIRELYNSVDSDKFVDEFESLKFSNSFPTEEAARAFAEDFKESVNADTKVFVDEINVNGEISYPEYICK